VANSAERIPDLMRRAFTLLRSGRAGPVVLEIPTDVAREEFDDAKFQYTPVKPMRSMGDPADVKAFAKLLIGAKRPVIYAGAGVLYAEAGPKLVQLAELLACPVGVTLTGKSAFPENHPLYLGAGASTTTKMLYDFLNRADVVAGIGTSFTKSNFVTPVPAGKVMLQITNDSRDINKDYTIEQGIVGDVGLVLDQLLVEVKAQLGSTKRDSPPVAKEIAAVRDEWMKEWGPRFTSDEAPLSPYRILGELNKLVDLDKTIITHDSGSQRNEMVPFWKSTKPLTYIGWGKSTQLGFGLGVMMGAKIARPDHLCINVMGDAAFGMTGLDFETAVRSNIPILTVVVNNNDMACETHNMATSHEIFGSRSLYGEYAAIGKALGGYSERVTEPKEIAPAFQRAIKQVQSGKSSLLEFMIKQETQYPVFPR
jgi:acetolactate synthase-1/2/3 large subunit